MDRITFDADILGRFPPSQPVQICDSEGKVVGVFQPIELLEPFIDDAEVERRLQEGEEYTTAEVLRYLESL